MDGENEAKKSSEEEERLGGVNERGKVRRKGKTNLNDCRILKEKINQKVINN